MKTKDVLLVDDEIPFLRSLAEGLAIYTGTLNIFTAENGKKAMEMLRTAVVDVVVTDLKMPVMDGFELLHYLRSNHPSTRVIVMTALDGAEVKRRLRSLGVVRSLEKPLDFKEIAHEILAA